MSTGRWQRYVNFWNEEESPEALALVRITFGAALCANVLEQLLNSGVLELFADPAFGGVFSVADQARLSLFRILPSTPLVTYGMVVLQGIAALCLMVGLFSRAAALLCLILQMSLNSRQWMYRFDSDTVYLVFCYLFLLAPAGAAWSLDARWRGLGRARIPAWPRRLLMAQVTIIYVRTGIVKMGTTWSMSDGWSALYYALNLPGLARWSGIWLASIYPLTQVGTFIAKWWEITFFMVPLSLFLQRHSPTSVDASSPGLWARIRRTLQQRIWIPVRRLMAWKGWRIVYLGIGVIMHLSLIVLMNLGMFPFVMMSLYPCFLYPQEVQTLWTRIFPPRPRPVMPSPLD